MDTNSVAELMNIGKTIAVKLGHIGVRTQADLRRLGSAKAYRALVEQFPEQTLPLCYYLYSLEGALQEKHWDEFTDSQKRTLRLAAGVVDK